MIEMFMKYDKILSISLYFGHFFINIQHISRVVFQAMYNYPIFQCSFKTCIISRNEQVADQDGNTGSWPSIPHLGDLLKFMGGGFQYMSKKT